jgi:ATP-dependent DNA helicase RecQ
MLWQPKDAGLLAYFIEQLNDAAEKERGWERYHAVRNFAESERCRHLQICTHFGQTPKWDRCEMCDVCGNVPSWITENPPEERRAKKQRRPKAVAEAAPRPETRPTPAPRPQSLSFDAPPDNDLLQLLKEWRRQAAQRASVPAYIVLSDAALVDLCRKQPSSHRDLLNVTGIGERKAELYGGDILAAMEAFRKGARAAVEEVAHASPADETIRLLESGKSFEEIATIRGRQVSTVVNMVADLVEKGRLQYSIGWVGEENHRQIEEAVGRLGSQWLKPLREVLPAGISYEQIRLVVAYVRSQTTGQA